MTSTVQSVPDNCRSAIPMLATENTASAIEFYKQVFGATELMRLSNFNGKIAYAEMALGRARIAIADENPKYKISPELLGGSPVIPNVYVEDVDTVFNSALAAGAKLQFPVEDQFWGDRSSRLTDPFGHIWTISTHKEDVSSEEIQKRFVLIVVREASSGLLSSALL